MKDEGLIHFKRNIRKEARHFLDVAQSRFTNAEKSAALVEVLARVFDDLDALEYLLVLDGLKDEEYEVISGFVGALDRLSPTPAETARVFDDRPADVADAAHWAAKLAR